MPLSPHKKPQKQDEEAFARDFLGWNGTLQSLVNFRKDIKNYKYWVSIITSRKHTEWHQAKKEMPRTPLPLLKLFKENLISLTTQSINHYIYPQNVFRNKNIPKIFIDKYDISCWQKSKTYRCFGSENEWKLYFTIKRPDGPQVNFKYIEDRIDTTFGNTNPKLAEKLHEVVWKLKIEKAKYRRKLQFLFENMDCDFNRRKGSQRDVGHFRGGCQCLRDCLMKRRTECVCSCKVKRGITMGGNGGSVDNILAQSWKKYLGNNNLLISNNYYQSYADFPNLTTINIDSYPNFVDLFNQFPITSNDEFLDIGSGLGLMCFGMRQRYNFRKIIGIELNKTTFNYSQKNLEIMKMDKIVFINGSIFEYNIPNTISYIYLFNPFNHDDFSLNVLSFEKIINKCSDIKNVTVIWTNLIINKKIKNIIENKFGKISYGHLKYPYVIIKF